MSRQNTFVIIAVILAVSVVKVTSASGDLVTDGEIGNGSLPTPGFFSSGLSELPGGFNTEADPFRSIPAAGLTSDLPGGIEHLMPFGVELGGGDLIGFESHSLNSSTGYDFPAWNSYRWAPAEFDSQINLAGAGKTLVMPSSFAMPAKQWTWETSSFDLSTGLTSFDIPEFFNVEMAKFEFTNSRPLRSARGFAKDETKSGTVPEPGSFASLFVIGSCVLMVRRRRDPSGN